MLRAASVVLLAAASLAGKHHDAVRRLQYTTGTYIPGTYEIKNNGGVHYVTYIVTEDGKVEVIDVIFVNTHGWGGTAELSENDTGEYEDYRYKITGGSYKWELARFSTDPNNPSEAILDIRHYNPSFHSTGRGTAYVNAAPDGTVPCATPAVTVPVESSLTFTVSTLNLADGTSGYLYVKLWSGTTLIPLSGCLHMTVVEAFPEKITTTSMTGDRRFFNVDMSPRPTASGYIDETGSVHTGQCTFPDGTGGSRDQGRTYLMYYHPDTHIIYWDGDEGQTTNIWTPERVHQSTSSCDPSSPTVSVPTYSGSCSTAYRDNDWSGTSGWLKLDAIDASTKGTTSSQSLGFLDPRLPLTHIELYYNNDNGLGIHDVSIQVGDTSYGVLAGWSDAASIGGDGWLETDQSCVWWMKIEMVWLDGPVGGPPCDGPHDDDSDEDDDDDSDDNSLVVILCVVIGALLVGIAVMIVVMKRRKLAKPPHGRRGPVMVEAATSPTAPPQLASIKAEALGMMAEEPIAEAVPQGHVSGAEAAAMAAGEPPPQPSVGWGRRFASWRAVAEPPPPPEAEFEPEI